MDIPGVYLSEIILVKKDSTNETITIDPNSKIQPTYNLSVLSEGIVFSLRTMDKNESNSKIIKDLADKLFEERSTLKTIGYKLFNNGSYQEEYLEMDNGTDISYAKSLASEEVMIYRNRSDR